jgi:hypothetical protein
MSVLGQWLVEVYYSVPDLSQVFPGLRQSSKFPSNLNLAHHM